MPKTKTNAAARSREEKARTQDEATAVLLQSGEPIVVPISEIDISPLNYRKFYKQQALEEFAGEIKQHGIISPPSVRKVASGRYELIVGERRFRAAKLAGFTEIPVIIRTLTDQEVREIQLAENLQREDPHPLHEAFGIWQLLEENKSIDDIAVRLGKSKTFVYGRIKLVSLIDPFQEMFLADAITITEALEIATLPDESQTAFYEAECSDWKAYEQFRLHNLSNTLARYRYDLRDAPFDPNDSNLLLEAGACATCSFNSATLITLFPELAEQAVCSNRQCYEQKCNQHLVNTLTKALSEARPDTLLLPGHVNQEMEALINTIPEAAGIPALSRYDVTEIDPPGMPLKEEYEFDDEDEQRFDEGAYEDAMADYRGELEAYHAQITSGAYKRGLLLSDSGCQTEGFLEGASRQQREKSAPVTAKLVDEAIKNKTATPELLEAAITRIREGEEQAKALDKEKVQQAIHKAFTESLSNISALKPTRADGLTRRLMIYQSLDYSTRNAVDKVLFGDASLHGPSAEADFLQRLADLTDKQHYYLIRVALSSKPESKQPGTVAAQCLNQVAQEAGINLTWIQRLQDEKAESRWEKKEVRIAQLRRLQNKLLRKQSADTASVES